MFDVMALNPVFSFDPSGHLPIVMNILVIKATSEQVLGPRVSNQREA